MQVEVAADAIFISGNGKLWDALDNKFLSDYDWSEFDHLLTKDNVLDASSEYIYDLCDRGAFINEFEDGDKGPTLTSVDISERYPAIRVKTIIEKVLNQEGYGVEWSENIYGEDLDTIYLLYTQDNAIRNSKEWEKNAIFDASGTASHTESGTGAGGFNITRKLWFYIEKTDNGDNFTGASNDDADSNIYTIPENGTYRFIAPLYLQLVTASKQTIDSVYLTISLKKNASTIFYRTYLATDLYFSDNVCLIDLEIDTLPTEFRSDQEISIWATFAGNVTPILDDTWILYLNQLSGTRFYNTVSRYYGAGSTVELGELMPDMKALDFISKVSKYLNLYSFYREERRTLETQHGRQETAPVKTIDPVLVSETVENLANYELQFNTDKAQPPDDIYFDNGGFVEDAIKFDFSRTLISDCYRLFGEASTQIPVLWEDGNPLTWDEITEPPKWKTKANLRILKIKSNTIVYYTMTFGGDVDENSTLAEKRYQFEEVDIEAYHKYDLELEQSGITLTARIEIDKLYDQTYFKSPLWITGYGRYWLTEAEQISGDLYKLKLVK